MGPSPAQFLLGFLLVSILLWIIFMFASRLLAWMLSRLLGASVGFRVGGWKCLRDIAIKFNKGSVESLSIGEIRLSLRQSLVRLGVGFISRDPKLQILICDFEIVIRHSSKKTVQKTRTKKSRGSGRGKWMVLGNMARFLSISVSELVVKTPKAILDIKELRMEVSKDAGSEAGLFLKLQLFPINIYLGELRLISDQLISSGGYSSQFADSVCSPFSCEEFSVLCELAYNREAGIVIQNLDITSGEVHVNLNEDFLLKEKGSSDSSSVATSGDATKNK
ncbi:hypothetical protein M569_10518, partial [Genlisea aurea]